MSEVRDRVRQPYRVGEVLGPVHRTFRTPSPFWHGGTLSLKRRTGHLTAFIGFTPCKQQTSPHRKLTFKSLRARVTL